ncbi:MAG: hypothetical protein QOD13_901 [Thermoleophilaceae bacterium]|nr:hypothetical protein [Thermoleophilaceae bacterium]
MFAGAFRGARPLAIGVVAVGLVAAVLLVATEFSTVASVDVASGSCEVIQDTDPDLADRCKLSGLERNGGALLLVAGLVAAMAWGAGIGGSRAAAIALIVLGAAVLAWALLVDLPVTVETGALGSSFEGARGQAESGLTLEIVGGLMAALAGALGLLARTRA